MVKLDGTEVTSFQKGPTWITQSLGTMLAAAQGKPDLPNENQEIGVDMAEVDEDDGQVGSNFNPNYTKSEKRRFNQNEKHQAYRKMLQHGINQGFRMVGRVSYLIPIL